MNIYVEFFVAVSAVAAVTAGTNFVHLPARGASFDEFSLGSVRASKGQFPYLVSIQNSLYLTFYKHNCGGIIISHHTVLTAAHCVEKSKNLQVVAGEYDLVAIDGTEQRRNVSRVITHPQYKNKTFIGFSPNDIAIILLDVPLMFGKYVKNIKIAHRDYIPHGNATLSGWGTTDFEYQPDILRTVDLPIMAHNDCLEAMKQLKGLTFRDEMLPESILCTGPLSGVRASCSGDSGGPLVQDDQVVGIVSWGRQFCGNPSGFTRVSAFTDWILKTDAEIRRLGPTTTTTTEPPDSMYYDTFSDNDSDKDSDDGDGNTFS